MKKFAIFLVLSLAGISCRVGDLESEAVQITNPDYKPRHQEFLKFWASISAYRTKASLDFENNMKQTWDQGDLVLVCEQDSGKEALYEALSGGKDTTTLVRVSGDTLSMDTGKMFSAYYPVEYGKDGIVPAKLTYGIPTVVEQIPMTASGSRNFDFENACALVRFSYTPAENMVVKKMVFSSAVELSEEGQVEMDFTTGSPVGTTMYKGRVSTFSIFLAPGIYSAFTVVMSGDDLLEEITLGYDLKVSSNVLTNVDLNMPDGGIINLSKEETANSYVINSPGEYFFVPTKGCSHEIVTGIDKVEVLWEMNNQDVAPLVSMFSTLEYVGGKISFTTPEKFIPGNAVLAAKDNDGTILWTWHIWACEDVISILPYDSNGKYKLMDRSLGALAAPTTSPADNKYSSSLLYQWGRKDPFPGQTTQGDRNLIAVKGQARSIMAGPATLIQSVANPTVFYTGTDWVESSSEELWSSVDKTIYDPCPPGYIVPPKAVFAESDESSEAFYDWYVANSVSRSGSFVFKANNYVYGYPLSAYFKSTDGTKDGKATVYTWTSDTSGDNVVLCYMYYASKKTHITPESVAPRATGASVRCMKIIK